MRHCLFQTVNLFLITGLIRISSIRNNKKYLTIKKIFEAGDFYAILSDIIDRFNFKPVHIINWFLKPRFYKGIYFFG